MNSVRCGSGRFTWIAAVALLLTASMAGSAQEKGKPITLAGLEHALNLHALKPAELIALIEKSGVDFVATPAVQAELRDAGAQPSVIDAVQANYRGAPVRAGGAPPARSSGTGTTSGSTGGGGAEGAGRGAPSRAGVYVRQGSTWVAVQGETATWKQGGLLKGLKKASGGLLAGEVAAEVPGTHGSLSIRSPGSFLIRTGSGAMMQDYMLVHLHEKHDNREFKVSRGEFHSSDEAVFRTTRLASDLYQLDLTLGSGDYAFVTRGGSPAAGPDVQSGGVFTFQIVQ